jgi:protein-disulfide isomerase
MCSFNDTSWKKAAAAVVVVAGIIAAVTGARGLFRPAPVPVAVPVVSGRTLGPADARVRIVEFTDFQCPACAVAAGKLHDEISRNGAGIFLELKHFPLASHKNARRAAVAAECALEQGRFWPMHDALFQTQRQWEMLTDPSDHFLSLARGLGVDSEKMMRCMVRPDADARVSADAAEGAARKVAATPTFFINGTMVVGGAQLVGTITEALK